MEGLATDYNKSWSLYPHSCRHRYSIDTEGSDLREISSWRSDLGNIGADIGSNIGADIVSDIVPGIR